MANRPVKRHSVVIGPGWLALFGLTVIVVGLTALVSEYGWHAFGLAIGLPGAGGLLDRWARED